MGCKRDGWREGVLGYVGTIGTGSWHMMVWRGLGEALNDKTTKGCGINSLGGSGFNSLGARAVDTVGTT
jgi:hypothetical protein